MEEQRPPVWATRFLQWYCREELCEDLEGDLYEFYVRNTELKGKRLADLIYIIDVFKFIRSYTIKPPQADNLIPRTMILGNYFKTSIRNMRRNKLFTGINAVGLAISMSVGLLLIVMISELKSFDRFNENFDRTYRVINTYQYLNEDKGYYASTSVNAGKRFEEYVPGIDKYVLMRGDFSGDVKVNDKILPLRGFWPTKGFFDVFSYKLLAGNPSTCFVEPYSVVLTRSSAQKLFDNENQALNQNVIINDENYTVTGIVEDPPFHSHLSFEMLGSFATIDQKRKEEENWDSWHFMWASYLYFVLPENVTTQQVQDGLDRLANEGNKTIESHTKIRCELQPMSEFVLGQNLSNNSGKHLDRLIIYVVGGLALVVLLSACFNYTNLSIARSLRRAREVGVRKTVGASRGQVFGQFIFESMVISLMAVIIGFGVFYLIRAEFLDLEGGDVRKLLSLVPGNDFIIYALVFALIVGLVAGFLPAMFLSGLNAARVLKNVSSVRLFRFISMRKFLIVFQYVLSICFIVAVSIGYKQYKYSVNMDLGFDTENILTMRLQGNRPELFVKELSELPEVSGISKSLMVTSTGNTWSTRIKYKDPLDSGSMYYNVIDENHIPLYGYELLAGENFKERPYVEDQESEIIVNEHILKRFQMGEPHEAIGEIVKIDGKDLQIIGVVRDFHYSTSSSPIQMFAFRYTYREPQYLNIKVATADVVSTMGKIEAIWKKLDPVHPIRAEFYKDLIEDAYQEIRGLVKIIGFLAFLAISIASLGLLGMVVFTTETRIREVSIRKVFGATEGNLMLLLGRGFIILLIIAAVIAVPATYHVMYNVLFSSVAYKANISFLDLTWGVMLIFGIALMFILSMTFGVARTNPTRVLRGE